MSSLFEDSGIDSEDKATKEPKHSPNGAGSTKHMDELEVAFRNVVPGPGEDSNSSGEGASVPTSSLQQRDDDSTVIRSQPPSTCRVLQRKLELKVERAKRNFSQHQQQQQLPSDSQQIRKTSLAANLIPISRLSIPGGNACLEVEQKPLVDYKTASSDDEAEEISFFSAAKLKNARHQRKTELSDTFSIQEMTIDSEVESDSDASQNLELLPPMIKLNFLDKLRDCFHCRNDDVPS